MEKGRKNQKKRDCGGGGVIVTNPPHPGGEGRGRVRGRVSRNNYSAAIP